MPDIDSHLHLWKYNPVRDSWINDDMSALRKDFLPKDISPLLLQNGINGCVVVQSDQSDEENIFQLSNALKNDFIKGVVGWIDLQSDRVGEQLDYYSEYEKLKGFRHILQSEQDRALMLKPSFRKGISLLNKNGFTYDILILSDQLKYATELVASFPKQLFVIDHLAKPNIKEKSIGAWKKDIVAIAQYENVYCKLSGMVTEADWKNHEYKDFTPYLDVVTGAFGTKRILYGSDWPMCLLASTYDETIGIVKEYFSAFSKDEQLDFFGRNASAFYKL